MVLTINEDRQSLSLVNCTENLVELSFSYTHETYFVNDEKITHAYYEKDYLVLEAYDTDSSNRTLAIFDLSNHTQPEFLLSWFSDDSSYTNYSGIAIEGNRFYLKSYNGYVKVLNITEDKSLEVLGSFVTGYTHGFMKIVDNYAIISVGDSLNIFNITDWENIVELWSYIGKEDLSTLDVFFVIDDLIYLSHFTTRTDNLLILLDWSDPTNPVFIRTFGYPYTENVPAYVLAVPVVFIVFTLGLKKHRRKE